MGQTTIHFHFLVETVPLLSDQNVIFSLYRGGEAAKMLLEMKSLNGREDLTNLLFHSRQWETQDHQKLWKSKKNTELLKVCCNFLIFDNIFSICVCLKSLVLSNFLLDQTACCYMFVEGNPAPTFKFYKVTIN